MSKDYATKKTRKRNATRFDDEVNPNSSFKTMLYSTVFGVVVALVAVYFYQTSSTKETEVVQAEKIKPKPSAKARYKAVPADEVESNEFSFHERLENKTIEVDPPPLPEPSLKTKRKYIMQCASLRSMSAAENMRAKIGMNGFAARIKKSTNEKGDWYRVQLGPYESKRQAERDRHQLERNNIENCMIW